MESSELSHILLSFNSRKVTIKGKCVRGVKVGVIYYIVQADSASGGVSTANIITIIAAIIAAIAAITAAFIAYKGNIKTLEQQKELAEKNWEQTKQANERVLTQQKEIASDNIQADVVSKARIDWIQKEREYLSDYMSLASNMQTYFAVWVAEEKRSTNLKTTENFLKYCEHPVKFQNLKNILIMSLGPDSGVGDYNNAKFIALIEAMYTKTEKTADFVVPKTDLSALSEQLKELTEFARNYFKIEWNKAKNIK